MVSPVINRQLQIDFPMVGCAHRQVNVRAGVTAGNILFSGQNPAGGAQPGEDTGFDLLLFFSLYGL